LALAPALTLALTLAPALTLALSLAPAPTPAQVKSTLLRDHLTLGLERHCALLRFATGRGCGAACSWVRVS
tara:strand:- start:22 stop:234 length:213 start_codon:yes stop_codon:yes gene_type:complete